MYTSSSRTVRNPRPAQFPIQDPCQPDRSIDLARILLAIYHRMNGNAIDAATNRTPSVIAVN